MHLLLAVSGGIAAYKACELVSLARKADHQVRVMMTANALRFVGRHTFEALSEHAVLVGTFQDKRDAGIDHIAWAQWADAVVVAPATANLLGKLACGLADDGVTTVLMAVPEGIPVYLAPAMNTHMWRHPVVQRNLQWIAELGRYHVIQPVEKRLACGDFGTGALAAPADILQAMA